LDKLVSIIWESFQNTSVKAAKIDGGWMMSLKISSTRAHRTCWRSNDASKSPIPAFSLAHPRR
jgi:hypothetical protein